MLVHSSPPTMTSPSHITSFDDFVNFDAFPPSLSRESSKSPSSPSLTLPATPPQPQFSQSFDNLFDFGFLKDQQASASSSSLVQSPPSVPDFFSALYPSGPMTSLFPTESNPSPPSAFTPSATTSASSSSSTTSPPVSASPSLFAIDPQLVAAPATPALGDIDEEAEDDEDSEDEAPLAKSTTTTASAAAAAVKGAKNSRRGTVAGGGVQKRTGAGAKEINKEPEDWRPSPEEYKKLSSKEKRQLRNKISARNFRVRRKEYITTLEGDIADRDRLIEAIRTELGTSKLENAELKREIETLKRALLEGRVSPALPPPAPLSPTLAPSPPSSRRQVFAKANTQKDLPPTSPRSPNARGFWGGSASFGGITPVHATLIPDFSLVNTLTGKTRPAPVQQENINPLLNNAAFSSFSASNPNSAANANSFDAFADLNPFTLKTLDAYRMQLWGRMARDAAHRDQLQQQQIAREQMAASGTSSLANQLKPAFFTSPTPINNNNTPRPSPTLSALLAGKSAYPTPPASPQLRNQSQSTPIQPQAAMLAMMASQTLLTRMGNAFWDAFSGGPSTSANAANPMQRNWDAEKVRKVLEGKAVVRVVDVEEKMPAVSPAPVDALEESMKKLNLAAQETDKGRAKFLSKGKCCWTGADK